jgi:hypothetical protein
MELAEKFFSLLSGFAAAGPVKGSALGDDSQNAIQEACIRDVARSA